MKFKVIQASENKKYLLGSPLQLVKSQVVLEQLSKVCFLDVQYFSMSPVMIQKICLLVTMTDKNTKKEMVLPYIFTPSKGFGIMENPRLVPIYIGEVENVSFILNKIVLLGGKTIDLSAAKSVDIPVKAEFKLFEKYQSQLKEILPKSNFAFAYSENGEVWRCSCGRVNDAEECFFCKSKRAELKSAFNLEILEKKYQQIEAEKAKKQAEKEAEIERMAVEKRAKDFAHAKNLVLLKVPKEVESGIAEFERLLRFEKFEMREEALKLLPKAKQHLETLLKEEEERKEAERKERERQAEIRRAEEARLAKIRKRKTIIISTLSVAVVAVGVFVYIFVTVMLPAMKYNDAIEVFEAGEYEEAIELFNEMLDYEDSAEYVLKSQYEIGVEYIEAGDYQSARIVFTAISGYSSSSTYLKEADKMEASELMTKGEYKDSLTILSGISGYSGVSDMVSECYYNLGLQLMESGDDEGAISMFALAGDYGDASTLTSNIMEEQVIELFEAENYSELITLLKNSSEEYVDEYMSIAVPAYEQSAKMAYIYMEYSESKAMYSLLSGCEEWLSGSALTRLETYPIFCNARLGYDNFDDVYALFTVDNEAYDVVEDIDDFLEEYMFDETWTDITDSSNYIEISSSGRAVVSVDDFYVSGTATCVNGWLRVDGDKVCEITIIGKDGVTLEFKEIDGTEYIFAK